MARDSWKNSDNAGQSAGLPCNRPPMFDAAAAQVATSASLLDLRRGRRARIKAAARKLDQFRRAAASARRRASDVIAP